MPNMPVENPKIAVIIPCYQEEKTIGKVVADFKRVLPRAEIYVYDNNCTDATARIARESGAIVRREKRQGKGYVVASMFEQVKADILVMVDGDGTYDADSIPILLEPILKGDADMTVASRLREHPENAFRNFHRPGNRLVCAVLAAALVILCCLSVGLGLILNRIHLRLPEIEKLTGKPPQNWRTN